MDATMSVNTSLGCLPVERTSSRISRPSCPAATSSVEIAWNALFYRVVVALKLLTMWLRNVLTIRESLVWDRRFGWFLLVIDSVSSRESTCNIAACIATSSLSSPGYYARPLSTPLIPRRRHERSTPPPLPQSSMPSVFLDIKGGMCTVS